MLIIFRPETRFRNDFRLRSYQSCCNTQIDWRYIVGQGTLLIIPLTSAWKRCKLVQLYYTENDNIKY